MTRIVGGHHRGRRLAVPPHGTRPTSARAREALFNRLDTLLELDGAHVLDLYAGSGAVGLEAVSRGAAVVWFVESDARAAAVLNANVDLLKPAPGVVQMQRRAVAQVLAGPASAQPFDVVFADPPYALDDETLAAALDPLAGPGWLHDESVIVIERSTRADEPPWPPRFEARASKRYGEGTLWYGRRK